MGDGILVNDLGLDCLIRRLRLRQPRQPAYAWRGLHRLAELFARRLLVRVVGGL